MMISSLTILTVIFAVLSSLIIADDPCRFSHTKGVIDLTSLGRTDGKAAFPDAVPATGANYKYSYNPCKPFTEGTSCRNVSACQVSLDETFTFPLGTQETASWNPGASLNDTPSLSYSFNEKKVVVSLQCGKDGSSAFEALGEDPMNTYKLRLTHKCACWDGCGVAPTTTTAPQPTTTPSLTNNSCRFVDPVRGVIDFTFIGRTDGQATYTDENTLSQSNFKYSYNPCRSFSEGENCIGVSVCQVASDTKSTVSLGTPESMQWIPGTGLGMYPSLSYSAGQKKVIVELQCGADGNNEFLAFGENPVNTYKFRLTHKCACWNGCLIGNNKKRRQ